MKRAGVHSSRPPSPPCSNDAIQVRRGERRSKVFWMRMTLKEGFLEAFGMISYAPGVSAWEATVGSKSRLFIFSQSIGGYDKGQFIFLIEAFS